MPTKQPKKRIQWQDDAHLVEVYRPADCQAPRQLFGLKAAMVEAVMTRLPKQLDQETKDAFALQAVNHYQQLQQHANKYLPTDSCMQKPLMAHLIAQLDSAVKTDLFITIAKTRKAINPQELFIIHQAALNKACQQPLAPVTRSKIIPARRPQSRKLSKPMQLQQPIKLPPIQTSKRPKAPLSIQGNSASLCQSPQGRGSAQIRTPLLPITKSNTHLS